MGGDLLEYGVRADVLVVKLFGGPAGLEIARINPYKVARLIVRGVVSELIRKLLIVGLRIGNIGLIELTKFFYKRSVVIGGVVLCLTIGGEVLREGKGNLDASTGVLAGISKERGQTGGLGYIVVNSEFTRGGKVGLVIL